MEGRWCGGSRRKSTSATESRRAEIELESRAHPISSVTGTERKLAEAMAEIERLEHGR
jgi:hypothetical protein